MIKPKVSVITVCFNSALYIKDTIESVLGQSYSNIEYIIVDGKSSDNTVQIIESYGRRITGFISEPDKGFYDAMNKGISSATGEIVCILNSDDLFIDSLVIEKVVTAFNDTDSDCVFGDLFYVDKNDTGKIIRRWKTGEFKPGSFRRGWHPAHPVFFLRRSIYLRYGMFDLSFSLAADFELMLRLLEKHKISSFYLPAFLVRMRIGGATNMKISNIIRQNIECIGAFKTNDLHVGPFYSIFRLFPKLKQYFTLN